MLSYKLEIEVELDYIGTSRTDYYRWQVRLFRTDHHGRYELTIPDPSMFHLKSDAMRRYRQVYHAYVAD